jgi:hypothetical protein
MNFPMVSLQKSGLMLPASVILQDEGATPDDCAILDLASISSDGTNEMYPSEYSVSFHYSKEECLHKVFRADDMVSLLPCLPAYSATTIRNLDLHIKVSAFPATFTLLRECIPQLKTLVLTIEEEQSCVNNPGVPDVDGFEVYRRHAQANASLMPVDSDGVRVLAFWKFVLEEIISDCELNGDNQPISVIWENIIALQVSLFQQYFVRPYSDFKVKLRMPLTISTSILTLSTHRHIW